MTLLLNRAELEKLLDVTSVIDAVERGFADYSAGKTVSPVRTAVRVTDPPGVLLIMPCAMTESKALGTKLVSVYVQNSTRNLPVIGALYVLADYETGFPLAVMDASYTTGLRTAAASAVATKYLAREDSKTLGIFGTGVQAEFHALCIPAVRQIERILVWGRSPEHARDFCAQMAGRVSAELRPGGSVEEVAASDIVTTCTTSPTPLFSGALLQPGAHVNNVGSHAPGVREMDTESIVRSTVVVDGYDAAWAESGDILIPLGEGAIGREHVVAELGEIVGGKKPGRQGPDEITLFKSNGLAFQDLVAAALAAERASAQAVGTEYAFS
ncbi:MAG: ornithine cyclodeaminase family protein [Chloroflexi bacterium]|nr:ornithine cyclodeaminase family protein [Chloroflexota bacterium]